MGDKRTVKGGKKKNQTPGVQKKKTKTSRGWEGTECLGCRGERGPSRKEKKRKGFSKNKTKGARFSTPRPSPMVGASQTCREGPIVPYGREKKEKKVSPEKSRDQEFLVFLVGMRVVVAPGVGIVRRRKHPSKRTGPTGPNHPRWRWEQRRGEMIAPDPTRR